MKFRLIRPMVLLLAGYLLSAFAAALVFQCFRIRFRTGMILTILIVSASILVLMLLRRKKNRKCLFSRPFRIVLLAVMLTGAIRMSIIGILEMSLHTDSFFAEAARCTVTEVSETSSGSRKYILRTSQFYGRAILYSTESFETGDTFTADLRLQPIENLNNPGEYDRKEHERIHGVYYQARLVRYDKEASPENSFDLVLTVRRLFQRYRQRLSERLCLLMPENEAMITSAMLLGEDEGVSREVRSNYQNAGVSHLLVISGLHLGIVYTVSSFLTRRIRSINLRTFLMLSLIWGYAFFTGAGTSTVRAAIFCTVSILQKRLSGKSDRINTACAAALILLVMNPLSIGDTGFQMSFGCVLSLSLFHRIFGRLYRAPRRLRSSLTAVLSITGGTVPLNLLYFGSVCPYQLILNLLLIPFMSILTALSFFTLLLSFFWMQGAFFSGQVLAVSIRTMNALIAGVLKMPFAVLRVPLLPWISIVLYYLIIAIWYYSLKPNTAAGRWIAGWSTGRKYGVMLLLAGMILCSLLYREDVRITFLNVGQGDCCILEASGEVYLIDAGPNYTSAIKPYLLARGIREIDGIFLSHYDQDHVEGALRIAQDPDFRVRCWYLPENPVHEEKKMKMLSVLHASSGMVIDLHSGERMARDGLTFTCLGPDSAQQYDDENSASMVLLVEAYQKRILFCGDADTKAEAFFAGTIGKTDVLKAGHHGSSTSTSEALLEAIRPEIAVISCDRQGGYGHPHRETIERLTQYHVRMLVTDDVGAITMTRNLFGWHWSFGNRG